jgi:hypothetical protein
VIPWDKLAPMDFSRLNVRRTVLGGVGSLLLVVSVLFLPWFSLTDTRERAESNSWLCGTDEFSCTGFETFDILKWLLIAAALAPPILAWIIVRGHQLTWPPGEVTMVVGFTAFVLIAYNGLLDKPAPDDGQEFGTSLDWGYWVALLSTVAIAATGFLRSAQERGPVQRKAPGTV